MVLHCVFDDSVWEVETPEELEQLAKLWEDYIDNILYPEVEGEKK